MTPVLEVRDLGVTIGTDEGPVLAVDGLSFDMAAGEVVALVGESGCGKSMTALAIMGLLPPAAARRGSVRLAGRELTALDSRAMRDVRGREIAMVFQEPMTSLNPAFTVGYQIAEVLRRHQGLSRRAATARAVELLDRVRIPAPAARIGEYPHQMSGGMRQRVMIAMAVACNPKVLIADEPTTALDVTIQAQVLDIMRELRADLGTAILLITHDLGVVADIADRVEIMYAGTHAESAPAGELFAAPGHPYTTGLLGAVPRPGLPAGDDRKRLQEIPGMVPTVRERAAACVFAPRCGRADAGCRAARPVLREIAPGHFAACFHPVNQAGALAQPETGGQEAR